MGEGKNHNPLKGFNLKIFEDETVLEPTNGPHEITIVWIHGMDMTAIDSIKGLIKGQSLHYPNTKYVLPQAPRRTISVDQRPDVISWYDVLDRSTFEKPLEELVGVKDIRESAARLVKIVEREIKILNGESHRVFVGGMSQGAAMALTTGLQVKQKIGGIVVASGYFFNITEISDNNLDTPLVAFHGTKDMLRPWDIVKVTYEELKKRKPINTEVKILEMGHDFDQDAIREKFGEIIHNALRSTKPHKPLKAFNVKIFEDETILEPKNGAHEITIVWIHGMEMTAIDSAKTFLKGPSLIYPNAKVVLPQASRRFITVDQRPEVISWYDVIDRSTFEKPLEEVVGVKDIRENADRLVKIVEREIKILNGESHRVFVGGMSQGAAMALTTGLQVKQKIGGIVVSSGYFFNITEISDNNLDTPLVAFHGTKDMLRPWDVVKVTYEELKKRKPINTEVKMLEMGHDFDQDAIRERFGEIIKNALKV